MFVGRGREYNKLELDQLLALLRIRFPHNLLENVRDGKSPAIASEHLGVPRVYVSEATMWEAITGHAMDSKRVPRSEWLLLLGIASTRSHGILQGDLGRLVRQDKRSVPKRTDTLVKKGYIVKRTTLIRGTKTSKMWLKYFAPPLPKGSELPFYPETMMEYSRQDMTESFDPVPWHTRWTGRDIDYFALASSIIFITKEWGVIRIHDLKAKLGVLGMRWQMKIVSKTCRFLNSRGAIHYVAARLDSRVFKDCIKFIRDPTPDDWSLYLATGKRSVKASRFGHSTTDQDDDEDNWHDTPHAMKIRLSACPPWSLGRPLHSSIAMMIQSVGDKGLSNPSIYALTLGTTFDRYLSSLTGQMSTPGIQPSHLGYLQLRSEHARAGKVASYLFFIPKPPVFDGGKDIALTYAFGQPPASLPLSPPIALTLTEICGFRLASQHSMRRQTQREASPSLLEVMNSAPDQLRRTRDRGCLQLTTLHSEREPGQGSGLIVTLRVPPEALLAVLKPTQSHPSCNLQFRGKRTFPRGQHGKPTDGSCVSEHEAVPNFHKQQYSPVNGQTGFFKKTSPGRVQWTLKSPKGSTPSSRPWKCQKCGKGWKNEVGLKYHLSKSQTSCNPFFGLSAQNSAPERQSGFLKARSLRRPRKYNVEASDGYDGTGVELDGPQFTTATLPPTNTHLAFSSQKTRPGNSLEAFTEEVPHSGMLLFSNRDILIPGEVGKSRRIAALGSPDAQLDHPALPRWHAIGIGAVDGKHQQAAVQAEDIPRLPQATPSSHVRLNYTDEASHAVPRLRSGTLQDMSLEGTENAPASAEAERIHNIILHKLQEQNGVLIGGSALCDSIADAWSMDFPDEVIPTEQDIQKALGEMRQSRSIVEHWHAFRDERGLFAKYQIIRIPELDASAPRFIRTIDRLMEARLRTSVRGEANSTVEKPIPRGRRLLAKGVAILDAPVYAAQLAMKRTAPTNYGSSQRRKRQKRLVQSMTGDNNHHLLSSDDTENAKFLPNNKDQICVDEAGTANTKPEFVSSAAASCADIQNLDPNLFLDYDQKSSHYAQASSLTKKTDPDGSQTLHFPGHSYHVSSAAQEGGTFEGVGVLIGEIEKRCTDRWTSNRLSVQDSDPYQRFLDRLAAHLAVELSWGACPPVSILRASSAHSMFIGFSAGPGIEFMDPASRISWPAEAQMNLETASTAFSRKDDEMSLSSSTDSAEVASCAEIKSSTSAAQQAGLLGNIGRLRTRAVCLASRSLTALPSQFEGKKSNSQTSASIRDTREVMAAFIAVRTLLGGTEKAVDWGLLLILFPDFTLAELRSFWAEARKKDGPQISKLTRLFQQKLLVALENDELPLIDFEDPLGYDWKRLINWTRRLSQQEFRIHSSRESLINSFRLEEVLGSSEDWREKYFHPLSSTLSRIESFTTEAGAIPIDEFRTRAGEPVNTSDVGVAMTWIKAFCITGEVVYSPGEIRNRFLSLPTIETTPSDAYRQAVTQLTQQRIICRIKKATSVGRPYRLNESYISVLAKMAQSSKFSEAATFKSQLDEHFRGGHGMSVPYTLSDGATMALTNLNAAGRIRLKPVGVPDIPFGFEPGNYESRKFPKSYYHFGLKVFPTRTYCFNEDIETLRAVAENEAPSKGPRGELPQWVDLFQKADRRRWSEFMGAFCFILATRGCMTLAGVCNALSPVIDEFEGQLIIDWGKMTGILVDATDSLGTNVGEWWWLAVPWLRQEPDPEGTGHQEEGEQTT